ncbi:PREDICTED: LETM1 domain-containing protein 1 isoform X1 [Lepidothrix coronata]|uniref:LETM1 domain-containing protein 1 isoform X1 n=1 Tax=Lepidothrix coronata TaxID=321398 RepID=A0A6J0J9E4_9PASS|nr:PREDICTED: LETM1 domain-containing protein 1 isoform X1 [Lepidothrix coronata]
MALSRAAARGALWRLGPAALGPCRGRMEPLPVLGAPRCQVFRSQERPLSSRATSRALVAAVAAVARRVNARYERYLERSFPRFYVLYSTFTSVLCPTGIQALFLEVKEIGRIRFRMSRQRLKVQQLPYRDMERLRQFRRDALKAIPIGIIAIPPFANFLVIVLMYFFPRQLLIRYFWTPQQQLEFLDVYDSIRRDSYPDVVQSLALAAQSLPEPRPRELLQQLCSQVQGGARPRLAQLLAVRSLFSGSPLVLNRLQVDHVRALSQVLFLTPHLPAVLLRHRLLSHILEIRHLDRALLRLGLGQLSEEELRAACYLRGLNATHLGRAECWAWLEQWLQLSCELQASEASLLAHSMVLLSLNYSRPSE